MATSTATSTSLIKEQEVGIRLRRLNSATSSTYADSTTSTIPPRYTSTTTLPTNPFLHPASPSTSSTHLPTSSHLHPFTPTSTLQIQAAGKACISFPTPSKKLSIPIFSLSSSGHLNRPHYLSIRATRRSGSCKLVLADDEAETAVASTTYFFGPGRCPQVKIGRDGDIEAETFDMSGKSLITRTICFESRKYGKFEWRYAARSERAALSNPPPNNVLLLEKLVGEERILVARLVRSDETRTAGSKSSSAGNGGKLEMSLGGDGKEETGQLVDEVTVVVTCLVMLKKEIDRLRTIQIMIMSGAASGGGS